MAQALVILKVPAGSAVVGQKYSRTGPSPVDIARCRMQSMLPHVCWPVVVLGYMWPAADHHGSGGQYRACFCKLEIVIELRVIDCPGWRGLAVECDTRLA